MIFSRSIGPRRVAPKRAPRAMLSMESLEARTLPTVDVLTTFNGINYNQSSCSCQPPDPMAAAGPDHIVQVVNVALAFYDKDSGAQLFLKPLKSFFARVGATKTVFDPLVTYDEMTGRFVVSILEADSVNKQTWFNIAVSNTSNPLDGFREMHRIETTEIMPDGTKLGSDYPKIGFNADAFVFTVNQKLFNFVTLQHGLVLTLDKATVLDRDPGTIKYYKVDVGERMYVMTATTMHGTQPGGPMYFVQENTRWGGDSLRVIRMTNVLSDTPTFVEYVLPVNPYDAPPNAVHTNGTIKTFESFILNADWRDNRLVATQHIGVDGLVRARWYEFDTSEITPSLVQQGDIDRGARVYTYFSAIAIAVNGDIGITFMESAKRQFVSMYVTGRAADDPLGTMQPAVVTHPGENAYTGSRGGDYSGLTVDPETGTTFWAASMYKPANSFWGTGIAHFRITDSRSKFVPPLTNDHLFALAGEHSPPLWNRERQYVVPNSLVPARTPNPSTSCASADQVSVSEPVAHEPGNAARWPVPVATNGWRRTALALWTGMDGLQSRFRLDDVDVD